jgi:hypothetical protein
MFRVGDEVRVKDNFWTIEDQRIIAPPFMRWFAGETGVIEKEDVLFGVSQEGYYHIHNMLSENGTPWIFAKQWLELVPATEITEVTETEMLNMF